MPEPVTISDPAATPAGAPLVPDHLYELQRSQEASEVLASILAEVAPAEAAAVAPPGAQAAPPAAAPPAAPPAPVEAAKPPEPAPAPAPEPAAQQEARGTLRLLEREKAASDREAELERRARELDAKFATLPQNAITPERAGELFQQDPIKFCEAIGIAPEQVSRAIIAAKLGDKAPPGIREAAAQYPLQKKLEATEAKIAALEARLEVERAKAGLPEFARAAPADKFPALAAMAAADPEGAAAEVDAEMEQGGYKITREEAASRAEKRLVRYQRAYGAAPAPAPAASAPAATQPSTPPPAPTTAPPAGQQKAETPAPATRLPPPRTPYWADAAREAEVAAALAEAEAIARRG